MTTRFIDTLQKIRAQKGRPAGHQGAPVAPPARTHVPGLSEMAVSHPPPPPRIPGYGYRKPQQ